MRSFEGTVWDPVTRQWVSRTPEVTEHRASYPVEKRWVPRKAIDIRPNRFPENAADTTPAERKAIWNRGQRSILRSKMDTADFWIVFITTELLRADAEKAALDVAQGRARPPHQRVRGVIFGKIYQELWNALNSNDFPGPLFVHNNQCWLVESDEERRLLHEALRKRLRTRQNVHKRLQFLDLIEPAGNSKKRRYGLALARHRRLSRRHLRKHDVIV